MEWEAKTSKWKAALEIGLDVNLGGEENILYLGASSGTTVGHLSSRTKGIIFSVEKAFQMAIPLVRLAEKNENIAPVFCDANDVDYIKEKIEGTKIDILFCDIPSFDQVEILIKNSELIRDECKILFSLKTQSIRQGNAEEIMRNVRKRLNDAFEIIEETSLEPFHKKHYFFVLKKR